MTTMKILEGTTDAANQSYYAAEGLKALGYDAVARITQVASIFLRAILSLILIGRKGCATLSMPCGWPHSPIVPPGNTTSSIFIVDDRFCRRTWIWACSTKRERAISSSIMGARYARGVIGGRIPTATAFLSISKTMRRFAVPRCNWAHARGAIVHDAEMGLYVPRVAPLYYVPLRIDADRFSPNFPDGDASRATAGGPCPQQPQRQGQRCHRIRAGRALGQLRLRCPHNTRRSPGRGVRDLSSGRHRHRPALYRNLRGLRPRGHGTWKAGRHLSASGSEGGLSERSAHRVGQRSDAQRGVGLFAGEPGRARSAGEVGRSYVERYHDYRKIAVVLAKLYETGEGPGDPLAAFAEVARQ